MHNDREGVGNQDDSAAVGDGSLIAITKFNRATLIAIAASVATIAGGAIIASNAVRPATATAVAPVYGEGTTVALSTDLAGNLRTAGGGGGGGNPAGGWLDSVRLVTSDSVRKVLGGWLDSLRAGRLDSTGLKRRAALDTLRYLLAGRLDSTAFTRRAAIDSLRFGRVADSIFFPLGGNRVKTVDSLASWFGSTAPTIGQKTMANALPVSIASDQSTVNVSCVSGCAAPASRTYVTLHAELVTGVTTEALITFTKNVNGTETTGQTAYTITNAKTFRIQTITCEVINTTTTDNRIRIKVRVKAAVSASSPIVAACAASGPAALAAADGFNHVSFPDGIDLVGDGSIQIGVSHQESVTTAAIASFTLVGYEY